MFLKSAKKWLYTGIGSLLFATAPLASAAYTPGNYTCSAKGNGGDVKIEVVVDANAIKSIKVLEHKETKGVSDAALSMVPERIIADQSLAVDGVSGATLSSNAIKTAAEECLAKAGGDLNALKTAKAKAPTETKALVEDSADVVIIGGGGAGMSGAYAASKNGASVIVLEKAVSLGGNTMRSGGGFNTADQKRESRQKISPHQLETIKKLIAEEPKNELHKELMVQVTKQLADFETKGDTYLFDSPEWHALQSYKAGDYAAQLPLVYALTKAAHENVTYLEGLGLVWKDDTSTIVGALWPRSHLPRNYTSGIAYIETFKQNIESQKLPVKILTQVKADELIVKDGRVTGVKATGADGTPYIFNAKKGVIIATGGFGANVEMRLKYDTLWDGMLVESVKTTNTPDITGDGIVMAEKVGANLIDMGYIQLLPNADPQTGASSGYVGTGTSMMVNKEGKRFVNELERRDVLVKAILKQPDGMMFFITNDKNAELNEKRENKYGENIENLVAVKKVFKGETPEALAKEIGVDPATLAQTIKDWNEFCKTQNDPAFGRPACADDVTLFEGPYYASPRAPAIHHTMGGIQINEQAQALDKNGKVIPGLWAAGEVTGGIHGTNRVGANAIPDAVSFGRIAGENAAK